MAYIMNGPNTDSTVSGPRHFGLKADIGHPLDPASLVRAVKDHFDPSPSHNFHIDIMYRINVLGPLLLMQAALPYLPCDRSGRTVNLSSTSSTEGFVGQSVYGGTKSALEAMTRTWARELAERFTVNAINPGPSIRRSQPMDFTSPLAAVREGINNEDLVRNAGFVGGPPAYVHKITSIVGMLCSEDSAWCTGQVICANGGMRMAI
ncbi:NAD(P)-binding protein [Acephala macrosclerotiorum]|nr:NAD(P)-binding protein [Acephala macrosclerotiorum]